MVTSQLVKWVSESTWTSVLSSHLSVSFLLAGVRKRGTPVFRRATSALASWMSYSQYFITAGEPSSRTTRTSSGWRMTGAGLAWLTPSRAKMIAALMKDIMSRVGFVLFCAKTWGERGFGEWGTDR